MLALVVNFHPELRRRARLHPRPMPRRHPTSRHCPDPFAPQPDPLRNLCVLCVLCGESFFPPCLATRHSPLTQDLPIFAPHQVLSFHTITNCPICKSFVLITIQQCRGWGVVGALTEICSRRTLTPPASIYLFYFQALARHFARTQNPTRSFSTVCALFAKNTRVGVSFFPKLPSSGAGTRRLLSATSHDSRITSHRHPSHCAGRRTVPQWAL